MGVALKTLFVGACTPFFRAFCFGGGEGKPPRETDAISGNQVLQEPHAEKYLNFLFKVALVLKGSKKPLELAYVC